MKIVFFIPTYYPEKNGIAIHCYNLIKHLKGDITVLSPVQKPFIKIPGFSSVSIPHPLHILYLLKEQYDIIHIHGYGNLHSLIGGFIGILRRKKVVWTIHGIPKKGIFLKIYNIFGKFLIKRSIVLSVSDISEITKNFILIDNGVDIRDCSDYREAKYVCYIGRLDRDKGLERLKEVKMKVLLVGPKEDFEPIGMEHIEVDYEKISEIYCKCRYVVLPSKYEGLPLVMLEAIAHKRPFIATPVGRIPEYLKKLFPNYEKYIIKDNIQDTIDNLEKEDLNEELENARKKLPTWQDVANKVMEIYGKEGGK
jgi:glycosyltransferase involved in cell wall biosynthesis